MADDTDFPPELVQAQRDYYAVDARVDKLVAQLPSSVDVLAGTAAMPAELRAAVDAARAERLKLVDVLYGHEYWETVDDRHAARTELQEIARR
ncbi:hypothetical protein [Sphaerisporangium aureirubrum]|uniref:Uncharacterized protein n=1 Tax=Sphaerisporangium aureirubrum TaxID=1544736 RepID=A0ABW1NFQ9_9ACTN